ncbi:Por secretion system C-terminal sorting domain-containing protein [Dyadobacter sp. SG02]|uniref:T9SS type A sorting domain-containing protein n=1 Tax=Dyadobacter sp. SG02 TaxID=1855291 RepID=UPI0008B1233D|nr:T9SS type A sorting domain-containing protein [Dyadobacter sp. SG02]SEI38135.1 Por secretion system C-terminal sorting domain-containing protein [Dyadobacter sp. SG02]
MKKLLLLVNLLLVRELSEAQSLGLPVVTSGHGSQNSGNVFLEWSIGEVAVATRKFSPNILSEGFLQPDPSYAFPVKLIYFNGKPAGASNELNWATSEETNNSHFEVQKSPDGIHFQLMDRVAGAGTVYAKKTYQTMDGSPYPHTYYRLKQVDYDGTFSLSSIIYIRQADHSGFALYPNPAADMLYLSGGKNGGPLHITVFKTSGDVVLQQTSDAGDHISLNIRQLLPGSYLIQVCGLFALPLWNSRFVKL